MADATITTAPVRVVKYVEKSLADLNFIAAILCKGDEAERQETRAVANGIRAMFPHLDDTTLAAITIWIADFMSRMLEDPESAAVPASVQLFAGAQTFALVAHELAQGRS